MWVCLGSNEMLHGTKKLYNCPPFIIINTARYMRWNLFKQQNNVHGSWLKLFSFCWNLGLSEIFRHVVWKTLMKKRDFGFQLVRVFFF